MTASELPLWITIVITVITNIIGVYVSMLILEKFKKDKLWEIVATVQTPNNRTCLENGLDIEQISYNYTWTNKKDEYIFRIYSNSQKESAKIKELLDFVGAKYIVHEEKAKLQ